MTWSYGCGPWKVLQKSDTGGETSITPMEHWQGWMPTQPCVGIHPDLVGKYCKVVKKRYFGKYLDYPSRTVAYLIVIMSVLPCINWNPISGSLYDTYRLFLQLSTHCTLFFYIVPLSYLEGVVHNWSTDRASDCRLSLMRDDQSRVFNRRGLPGPHPSRSLIIVPWILNSIEITRSTVGCGTSGTTPSEDYKHLMG